jgi:carnitine-CoA ligase
VAILSPNRPEMLLVILACGWLGAIAVPINIAVKTRQLRFYIENSGAQLLVADGDLLAKLKPRDLADLPLQQVWCLDVQARRNDLGVAAISASLDASPVDPAPIGPGDPLAILYTSGTTGAPKGVVCPHAQFHWWGFYTAGFLDLCEGDRLATTLPLFHTNALNTFFQALLTGSTFILLPKFSASTFWKTMVEERATVGYLLGAMVPILLAQPPNDYERQHVLRAALGPGVPQRMHETLFERTGLKLADGFGSTETNFVIGTTPEARVEGRIGRLAHGIDARVVDALDEELPAGEAGELILRASIPYVFSSGYFGLPERTVEAWRNLWFHTGDRVIRYADGSFNFIDRIKDVIRRRGENISSFEVEQVLSAIPGIETVAVYPVPSDLAEDEVMAALVVQADSGLTAGDIFLFCEKELPRYAVPRYLDFLPELPRTENGKVQKFVLIQRGVTKTTIDRQKI